ncbi:MAG: phosphate ABC transporter substrate-binding protein PstS [Acidimicrobiales bacterium]
MVASACSPRGLGASRGPVDTLAPPPVGIEGATSSFMAPLVTQWVERYRQTFPTATVGFDVTGSGQALGALSRAEVDFAVSGQPLDPAELTRAGGADRVIQLPVAGGALALAYRLEGIERLSLSADSIAGIFSGRIRRWNDPALATDNPGQTLPNRVITPLHRSDPSATTVVLTEYLRRGAPDRWSLGVARRIAFPVGTAVAGEVAMGREVARTEGAIGYLAAPAAVVAGLRTAAVANAAGRFISPTTAATFAALDAATGADAGLAVFVPPDQMGPAAYPMVLVGHFDFVLPASPPGLVGDLRNRGVADDAGQGPPAAAAAARGEVVRGDERWRAVASLAAWVLTEGQRVTETAGYVPLPQALQQRSLEALAAGRTRPPPASG